MAELPSVGGSVCVMRTAVGGCVWRRGGGSGASACGCVLLCERVSERVSDEAARPGSGGMRAGCSDPVCCSACSLRHPIHSHRRQDVLGRLGHCQDPEGELGWIECGGPRRVWAE